MKVRIKARVPFYSTENKTKLETCINNLLGYIPELTEEVIFGNKFLVTEDCAVDKIQTFFNFIREAEILDSVRSCAILDYANSALVFNLHKQALYAGKFATVTADTASPLGNVELWIYGNEPEKILDWIAPQTIDGKEQTPKVFSEIDSL